MPDDAEATSDVLTLTAEIVASYLGNASHVSAAEIPAIIKSVRDALSEGLIQTLALTSLLRRPRHPKCTAPG